MKRALCLILIVMLAAAALTGCGKSDDKKTKPETDPAPVQTQNILLQSESGAYQFTAPETWKTSSEEIVKDAELEAENTSEAAFAVALIEEGGANSLNLQDYAIRVAKKMRTSEDLTDSEVLSTAAAVVAGRDAIRTEIVGTVDAVRIHYWIYCLVNGTDLIQLTGWCLNDAAASYQTEIPAILESFEINQTASNGGAEE